MFINTTTTRPSYNAGIFGLKKANPRVGMRLVAKMPNVRSTSGCTASGGRSQCQLPVDADSGPQLQPAPALVAEGTLGVNHGEAGASSCSLSLVPSQQQKVILWCFY